MFNLRYRIASNQRLRRLRTALAKGRMRRQLKTAIAVIASSTILVFCYHYRLSAPAAVSHLAASTQSSTFDTLAKARLTELQARYTAAEVLETTGLKTGNFTWEEYVKEIRGVYQQYFMSPPSVVPEQKRHPHAQHPIDIRSKDSTISRVQAKLDEFLDLLSYGRNASAREVFHKKIPDSFPHIIYTTSKETSFPEQFETWENLNSRAGWQVKSYNDDDIWQWMVNMFGESQKTVENKVDERGKKEDAQVDAEAAREEKHKEASEHGKSPLVLDVYQQIDNGVLRSDIFRYLALLLEGGVYTDTDTACIRPIIRWPGIRESHWDLKDITDPLLVSLPHMADLVAQAENRSTRHEVRSGEKEPVEIKVTPSEAIRNRLAELKLDAWDPPKLIIGVEFDYWGPAAQKHWTESTYSRGMQIVQSTIMAQPGHPIFVDVLGRIFKDIQNGRGAHADDIVDAWGRKKPISPERLLEILDFTGPGVFSDAVFRYLLARWGVHPKDLTKADGPMRVGDTLIYPLNSFTSTDSYYNRFQGEHRLVWHQFRGTWKGW